MLTSQVRSLTCSLQHPPSPVLNPSPAPTPLRIHLFNFYPIHIKPRAKGATLLANTVKLPTLLNIACCVRLQTLLHVVGRCSAKFNTGQTFSYVQTDPTTPNIARPTMLGVVGSVCTWLLSTDMITQCSPGAPCIGSCTSFTFLKPIWRLILDCSSPVLSTKRTCIEL